MNRGGTEMITKKQKQTNRNIKPDILVHNVQDLINHHYVV